MKGRIERPFFRLKMASGDKVATVILLLFFSIK